MDINKIWSIVVGESNEADKQLVLAEIEQDKEAQKVYNELKNIWALLSSTKEMPLAEANEMYSRFKKQLPSASNNRRMSLGSLFKYAAIFILGVMITSLSVYLTERKGWMGSDKEFIQTVVADKGQISKVILPDSSVVWINSGSKITYNSKFARNNRKIDLVGQAFFHAAHNEKIPFVVDVNGFLVKVLGTKFDVNAYSGEKNIRVVLESGRVELCQSSNHDFKYTLSPGEMATFNLEDKKLTIDKVKPELFSSWKEGVLIFRDKPMTEVLDELQRRYNIDIEVKDHDIYKSVFTARLSDEPLDKVLKSMEFSCSLKATIIRDPQKTDSALKVILSKP
ncbi:FecR family protein [Aquipluma nitroreducens]|nr:FecR domain-containing protein [Aquipluma nitroreducens]